MTRKIKSEEGTHEELAEIKKMLKEVLAKQKKILEELDDVRRTVHSAESSICSSIRWS